MGAILQFTGIFLGFLIGGIYDKFNNFYQTQNSKNFCSTDFYETNYNKPMINTKVRSSAMCNLLTTLIGIIASLLASYKNAYLQYLTFSLQLIFRCAFYGNNAQTLLDLYPKNQFAKLLGVTFC